MKKKKINEETMTNNEMKQTIDNKGKEELNNDAWFSGFATQLIGRLA